MAEKLNNLSLDREIRMRVTLTQMIKLAMKHSRTDINQRQLNAAAIENLSSFDDHHLGSISIEGVRRQVLVK
jgi:hypothetical protein